MNRLEIRQIGDVFEVNMSSGGDVYTAVLDEFGFRNMLDSCNKLLPISNKKHNSFYT